MLQKLNTRRGGFTLVEIMIVVAIIALLAAFAAPSLMRARKRTQAGACKQDLKMVADATDQWAIEKNKSTGNTPTWDDIKPYMKENSRLASLSSPTDTLGNAITLVGVGTAQGVPASTYSALSDVAGTDFWAPYVTGT